MTSSLFWQNSVRLCPAHFLLQVQTCLLLQVSLEYLYFDFMLISLAHVQRHSSLGYIPSSRIAGS